MTRVIAPQPIALRRALRPPLRERREQQPAVLRDRVPQVQRLKGGVLVRAPRRRAEAHPRVGGLLAQQVCRRRRALPPERVAHQRRKLQQPRLVGERRA
eukprot:5248448-Prymnesium_polylepis.1